MKKSLKKVYRGDGQDKFLPKLSLKVFDKPRTVALIWLCVTIFGVASYATLLKREGFPSVNVPFTVIGGAYLVDDSSKVDQEVAKPIGDIILKDERVKSVQTYAQSNFYGVIVQYESSDINAQAVSKELEKDIQEASVIPEQAVVKVETPRFGFTERGDDTVISFYAKNKGVTTEDLSKEAGKLVEYIDSKNIAGLKDISVIEPFLKGVNPATGQMGSSQTKFDRYGERKDGQNKFYDSVSVGITHEKETDIIEINAKIEEAVAEFNQKNADSNFYATVSGTYAKDIEVQIDELQKALLEGLIAVLVIGSIVIAIRASLITVLSMLTVLAITLGVLYGVGYSLNTITLFSLILCLGLIVDDTIIMVEAIDAQRRKNKDPRKTVKVATRKVSRAMVAATSTAALSFAPLLFVGGILGGFIRAIPVTVITSLLVSLLVALFFIPFFARFILLGKKQMGEENVKEPAAALEAKVAEFVCRPMIWAKNSNKKLAGVGLVAVFIGLLFVGGGGWLFNKVTFNIFPPSKDSNALSVQMNFPGSGDIKESEKAADKANKIIADKLGDKLESASNFSMADAQKATLMVYLTPYNERKETAPQLIKEIEKEFEGVQDVKVKVAQVDAGPPATEFKVRIETDDREVAQKLAQDMKSFLSSVELVRPSGTKAKMIDVETSNPGTFYRANGKQYTDVSAGFTDSDTTTLVTLAQDAVKKEFDENRLADYGLSKDMIKFDLGQEQENQDSFKTLALAFPLILVVIYILLAIQFRSLAQPLLIFMAIPFSLFGITLGLYLTDNAFSFFAMLGFFALIGLSIKNTILLTDFANQLRRTGSSAVDAAVGALEERFRPLLATSLTAVVSLIPLFLASPFWQGLTVVLIFGLLSSTFLVITVFPYYYLGAEYMRLRVRRRSVLTWLLLTVAISFVAKDAKMVVPIAIGVLIAQIVYGKVRKATKA